MILLTQRHVIVKLDGEQNLFIAVRHDVPVENAEGQGCKASEECVIQVDVEVIKEGHCTETTVVSKDELRHRHHAVFVEEVEDELGDREVAGPSVYQYQTPEHLELWYGEVRGLDGTQALVSVKANADMSLINHGHIISSIAHSQSNCIPVVFLDHPHYICLLFGRDTAANDCLTRLTNANKVYFEV